jgi:8-oxo-dGTP diphosphatase
LEEAQVVRKEGAVKNEETIPHIHVACALVERNGLILAAQRGRTMSMPLRWEFPGGKIEAGESPEACLKRELLEEMDIVIAVRRAMPPCTHSYRDFTITLHPFVCTITSGEITFNEHRAIAWLSAEELPILNWTEADAPVIDAYRQSLTGDR